MYDWYIQRWKCQEQDMVETFEYYKATSKVWSMHLELFYLEINK